MNVVLNCEQAVWAAHACQIEADHLDRLIHRVHDQHELTREWKRDRDQYREIYSQIHEKIELAMDTNTEM